MLISNLEGTRSYSGGESLLMTSCSSMDSCQDESGECGQTESRCVPYVREQNPPAVRELPVQSTSNYE